MNILKARLQYWYLVLPYTKLHIVNSMHLNSFHGSSLISHSMNFIWVQPFIHASQSFIVTAILGWHSIQLKHGGWAQLLWNHLYSYSLIPGINYCCAEADNTSNMAFSSMKLLICCIPQCHWQCDIFLGWGGCHLVLVLLRVVTTLVPQTSDTQTTDPSMVWEHASCI